MAIAGKHGVSANTPKNVLFGAGTIHKNLTYTSNAWNFDNSIVGATNGGSKLSIVPEFYDVPVDGALVPVKELKQKVGETATMEVNFAEVSKALLQDATNGAAGTSTDSTYNMIESKGSVATGDFWENVAFVGETLEGKKIIAVMENALITSGLEQEGKNKEGAVLTLTFTCHADIADANLDRLPWKIYYPAPTL